MASAKKVFKALPEVNEVWVDSNGAHHLYEVKGAEKFVRREVDLNAKDDDDELNLSPEIADVEKLIAELKDNLATSEDTVASLTITLLEKDDEIALLHQTVKDKDDYISQLGQAISEQATKIVDLESSLADTNKKGKK